MIQTKIWGTTSEIFSKNNVEIHRLEIKKGAFCSQHFHKIKFNGFFCESGEVDITIWRPDSDLIDITTLQNGAYTTVEPGVYHKFTAKTDSIIYEIYWTEISKDDIYRRNFGGIT